MTRLKICGITRLEDARCAVEVGADYLGLVFAPGSPRLLDPTRLDWLDEVRGDAELVGVFRDQEPSFVREVALELDLDLVQLHGTETGNAWRDMPVRILEATVAGAAGPGDARLPGLAWGRLVDGGAGQGMTFDWSLAADLARSDRLFVAGGFTPRNVGAAIRTLRPFAVDVSSGVEREPGLKDPALLKAFARALEEVDADGPIA